MHLLSTNASDKPLYAALGLPEDATPEEIHQAYLNISRAHHPDVGGDPNIFAQAKHAHDILMDPEKRRIYDETGLNPDNEKAFDLIRRIAFGALDRREVNHDLVAILRRELNAELMRVTTELCTAEDRLKMVQLMSVNISKRWRGSLGVKRRLLRMLEYQRALAENDLVPLNEALENAYMALDLIRDAMYVYEQGFFDTTGPIAVQRVT